MKQYLKSLVKLRTLWLLLLFVSFGMGLNSCKSVEKAAKEIINFVKNDTKMKEKNNLENRHLDKNISQMSMEEFQEVAEKYFSNQNVHVKPWYYIGKDKNGEIMKEENSLYYVQSFTARGENENVVISVKIAGVSYFISDPTKYLIINDYICDAMGIANVDSSNAIYAIGFKAELY